MKARSMRRRATRLVATGLVGLLALPGPAWAVGPLEKDHPLVQRGREAYAAGRYEDALRDFDAAKKERPGDPIVEFNRADALAKLGRSAEAREAFKQVAEASRQPDLTQKSWYNLGNLAATAGDRKEALKSYRRALTLDPTDPLARHNYEVVLRDLPPQQQNQPDGGADGGLDGGDDGGRPDGGEDGGRKEDGGSPVDGGADGGTDGGSDGGADGGSPDGGGDGGADGGGGDGGPGDGGGADGGPSDGGGDGGADGGADGGGDDGEGDPKDGGTDGGSESEDESEADRRDGGSPAADVDRQEAERLLDAMKQNEKNLQLWRFQQKKKPRKPNEKDW
ncbi:tetratricopeptide repeat protein [Corallococcus terminator]|uniref:Tetratricopeptide repeat protein n=1 Tax=Corallococcus terminator TaxID=2316733 RepID=A0A3A8J006_9BACT|nr:tetratricopeptide repeat protein [Corallococcus terminator]RKG83891.1 tetratricopeptide repeat protein [Corallococcus terminator]